MISLQFWLISIKYWHPKAVMHSRVERPEKLFGNVSKLAWTSVFLGWHRFGLYFLGQGKKGHRLSGKFAPESVPQSQNSTGSSHLRSFSACSFQDCVLNSRTERPPENALSIRREQVGWTELFGAKKHPIARFCTHSITILRCTGNTIQFPDLGDSIHWNFGAKNWGAMLKRVRR